MNPFVKNIQGCVVIDQPALWDHIKEVPKERKLTALLRGSGVQFHDCEGHFIAKPVVALTGIGGIPFSLNEAQGGDEIAFSLAPNQPFKLKALRDAGLVTMGMSAFYSYLNPRNSTPHEMCEVSFNHGHTSIAHTVVVNMVVLGHSCGVENEFNSQRDLIHISRLTVARTQSQLNPPLVVLEKEHLPYYEQVRSHTLDVLEKAPATLLEKAQLEGRNLLFPAAKGSGMMITASLRNLQKLMAGIDDQGKEEEYKRILRQMNDVLSAVWDMLFKVPGVQKAA